MSTKYSEEIIKGKVFRKILPDGFALVLEGGGTRGFYSSGVFEAFMEEDILFPYMIGVSAGAANVLSYISGQRNRSRMIIEKYVSQSEYMGYRNFIRHKSFFGYDYVFKTVPSKHVFWDKEAFDANKVRLLIGTTDVETGQSVWFEKSELDNGLDSVIASCSIPLMAPIISYKDYKLLDGAIASPIPIDKAIEDGNEFFVIILTRNLGYRKKPFKYKRLLNRVYKKYPKFIDAMLRQYIVYNNQLDLCEKLEKEGKAIIIRPKEKIKVSRTGSDSKRLLELHDEGYIEGKEMLPKLLDIVRKYR